MSGYISKPNKDGWDPEKESWDEYKANRFSGMSGLDSRIVKLMQRVYVQIQIQPRELVNVELVSIEEIEVRVDANKIW